MSEIILNNSNLSRFNKRLQKALEEYIKQPIKLTDAAKIMAKAIGKDTPEELKKALKKSDSYHDLVNVYLRVDKHWFNSYQIPPTKKELSYNIVINGLYSEKVYEDIKNDDEFLESMKETNDVMIAVQIDKESLIENMSSALFAENCYFEIYLLEKNGHLKTKHD